MSGCYLKKTSDLQLPDPYYALEDQIINMSLNTYKKTTRNLGVLLSGTKGVRQERNS